MNIGVHLSFWIMFFSGYMFKSGIAESYGSSTFVFFLRNFILFYIVAVPVCIPSNSVGGFPSLQHLLSLEFLIIAILAGVR